MGNDPVKVPTRKGEWIQLSTLSSGVVDPSEFFAVTNV